MLINLVRGTGIAGLHGILPRQNRIIRPMLFTTRQEIEAYMSRKHIPYRNDSSNDSLKYERNKIRHHVIPLLKELNPDLVNSMVSTAGRLHDVERTYRSVIEKTV
jgi:tRNA(Ile)-lysidine synthase